MLVVAAALINQDNAILVQQRPPGRTSSGAWEFPGGKVESNERARAALVRELAEELGIEVEEDSLEELSFVTGILETGGEIVLLLYICRFWVGEPSPLHATEVRWVVPELLRSLPLLPLDESLWEKLEEQLRL